MFDTIKTIYHKTKLKKEFEYWEVMVILNILIKDKDMVEGIKKSLSFLFNVSPTHFIYLLYFNTPKKYNISYNKINKNTIKNDNNERYNDICKYFNWSDREKEMYKNFYKLI